MAITVGAVVDGVVTGITNFGAFIQLGEEKNGLVHISEISQDYVENVFDYLKKGQKVKVKVLSIGDDGKIALSMRQAKTKTTKPGEVQWGSTKKAQQGLSFEDKLNMFLKESSDRSEQMKTRDNRRGSGSKANRFNND